MEHQDVFAELSRRANDALENVENLEAFPRYRQVIQICEKPWFSNYISWTVFAEGETKLNPIVRQLTWKRLEDVERFRNPLEGLRKGWTPQPTLEIEEVFLKQEKFSDLMVEGATISIPLVDIKTPLGLDGTSYILQVTNHFGGFRLNWWSDGPQEWHQMIQWAHKLRKFFVEVLGEKE